MNAETIESHLTPGQITRRRFIGKSIVWGALFTLAGVIGAKSWYDTSVRQYPEGAVKLQELLNHKRNSRLIPYAIDGTFASDDQHHLYVPNSIDGTAIKLAESPDLNGRLIQIENIIQDKVLEAKIGAHYGFTSTTFTYEGDRLLITEREIIKQIMRDAVAKAKSLGASTFVPTINFDTQLTPDIPRGAPSYWNSKTTISGNVRYYR